MNRRRGVVEKGQETRGAKGDREVEGLKTEGQRNRRQMEWQITVQ
jgi:hypothetical protein